jgi:hypothetical protein
VIFLREIKNLCNIITNQNITIIGEVPYYYVVELSSSDIGEENVGYKHFLKGEPMSCIIRPMGSFCYESGIPLGGIDKNISKKYPPTRLVHFSGVKYNFNKGTPAWLAPHRGNAFPLSRNKRQASIVYRA